MSPVAPTDKSEPGSVRERPVSNELEAAKLSAASGSLTAVCAPLERAMRLVALVCAITLCLPITVNWIAFSVGIFAWLAVLIWRAMSKQQVFRKPPLLYPLLAMAAALTISGIANSGNLRDGWSALLTLRPLIVYFWSFDVLAHEEPLRKLCLTGALLFSSLAGLAGALEQVANFHPFGFRYLQGTGFLSGPMAFAGQMQIFSLLALAILLTKGYKQLPGKFNAITWTLVTAANVLGVAFAGERNGWLGFCVGALVLMTLLSWQMAARISVGALAALALVWNFIPVFKTRLMPLLDPAHDVGVSARLVMWQHAWQIFTAHPLLGVGPLNFPHIVIPEALVPGQPQYLDHAHNNYLHILATTGIVGLSAFAWLLVGSFLVCFNQWCRGRDGDNSPVNGSKDPGFDRALALGLVGALVSLAVAGLFEYNFGTGQVRLAQWFFLAFILPCARVAKGER